MSDLETRHLRAHKTAKSRTKSPSTKWLVYHIRDATGLPIREINAILHAMTCLIQQELAKGNRVNVWSLGTFSTRFRKGRTILTRPMDGPGRRAEKATIVQADSYFVKFKPSPILKEHVRSRKPIPMTLDEDFEVELDDTKTT